MSLVVNTNLSSLNAMTNLANANQQVTLQMQRLSTGLRINSASDDAAGLALSEKFSAQISASDIVKNNTMMGVNMLQIADSDLAQISENVQRMRDLAVQSANGAYTATERSALNQEYQNRIQEVARIIDSSSFASIKLLDGTAGTLSLQIGTNNSANDQLSITNLLAVVTDPTGTVTTQSTAQTAITTMDTYINTITTRRASIGATLNTLQETISRTDSRKTSLESANSVIKDADIASASALLTKSQILMRSSTAMLQQANQMPSLALSLIGT